MKNKSAIQSLIDSNPNPQAQAELNALLAVVEAANRALAYAACCMEHPSSPSTWNEHRKIVREARIQIQQLHSITKG